MSAKGRLSPILFPSHLKNPLGMADQNSALLINSLTHSLIHSCICFLVHGFMNLITRLSVCTVMHFCTPSLSHDSLTHPLTHTNVCSCHEHFTPTPPFQGLCQSLEVETNKEKCLPLGLYMKGDSPKEEHFKNRVVSSLSPKTQLHGGCVVLAPSFPKHT